MAKSSWLFVERCSALLANSYFAVATNFMSYSNRTAGRAHQRHVRQGNPALLFGDSAFDVALRIRPDVFLNCHHMFHQHLALVGEYTEHAPFLAGITSRHDFD